MPIISLTMSPGVLIVTAKYDPTTREIDAPGRSLVQGYIPPRSLKLGRGQHAKR